MLSRLVHAGALAAALLSATAAARSESSAGSVPALRLAQAAPGAEALDLAFWNSAQAANECEAVKAYLARFPQGLFVDLARIAERRLCQPAAAATGGPVPAALMPAGSAPAPDAAPAPAASATANTADEAAAPARAPAAGASEQELVRTIQMELARVGCGTLAADGAWNPDTQQAVLRFNQHGRWRFDPASPSPTLLAALRRNEGRVCPLECGAGFEARDGTCVAAAPPPAPRKKAERSKPKPQKRAQPRREEQRRVQTGVRQAAPVPNPGSSRGGRTNCRFVQRPTGGGYNGDTVEVCN